MDTSFSRDNIHFIINLAHLDLKLSDLNIACISVKDNNLLICNKVGEVVEYNIKDSIVCILRY